MIHNGWGGGDVVENAHFAKEFLRFGVQVVGFQVDVEQLVFQVF